MKMVSAANRDFYKILGVPRSAKERDIKKAFKKMSIKYHPDKNPGDAEAAKKYQDITAAYDALGDAERRRKYDQAGEEGLNRPDGGGGGHDPFDIFGDFFGGG
jgi:DnaJ-related protein SCJ1